MYATEVTLRGPYRPGGKLPDVTVNVVLVREEHPPENEVPVEWVLLTSLPIANVENVRRVIQCYTVRWMIEIYFRVLKSGCRVETRRLETLDRQLNCLAIFMIVAWRTLFVCRLGRSCSEMSCEVIFEPAEWRSTWKIVKKQDPPPEPPTLGVMVKMVAQLGGYVYRAHLSPALKHLDRIATRLRFRLLLGNLRPGNQKTSTNLCVTTRAMPRAASCWAVGPQNCRLACHVAVGHPMSQVYCCQSGRSEGET